jgi:hypothetical protein
LATTKTVTTKTRTTKTQRTTTEEPSTTLPECVVSGACTSVVRYLEALDGPSFSTPAECRMCALKQTLEEVCAEQRSVGCAPPPPETTQPPTGTTVEGATTVVNTGSNGESGTTKPSGSLLGGDGGKLEVTTPESPVDADAAAEQAKVAAVLADAARRKAEELAAAASGADDEKPFPLVIVIVVSVVVVLLVLAGVVLMRSMNNNQLPVHNQQANINKPANSTAYENPTYSAGPPGVTNPSFAVALANAPVVGANGEPIKKKKKKKKVLGPDGLPVKKAAALGPDGQPIKKKKKATGAADAGSQQYLEVNQISAADGGGEAQQDYEC